MATINDGEINLSVEGADEAGLRRGLIAARVALDASGVAIEQAFCAWFDRDGADIGATLHDLSDSTFAAADALDNAVGAAVRACFPDKEDPGPVRAELSMQSAFTRSERRIDRMGVRHLNPDLGPHFAAERRACAISIHRRRRRR